MKMRRGCIPYLQLLILLLLRRDAPLCGHRIYLRLRSLGLEVEEAAIYTALSKLRKASLIRPIRGMHGARIVVRYELTRPGIRELESMLKDVGVLEKMLRALGTGRRGTDEGIHGR